MRVDEPRQHVQAARVDLLPAPGQLPPDLCDHAVAAADVAARRAVREVDGAAAEDEIERHAASRSAIRRRMILTISSSATASSISGSCASRSSYAWRIASFDHSRTQITNGNPNRAR